MADDQKTLIAVVKPMKPVSEMTDEEIDRLTDQLFEATAARINTSRTRSRKANVGLPASAGSIDIIMVHSLHGIRGLQS